MGSIRHRKRELLAQLGQVPCLGLPAAPYPPEWIEERALPLAEVLETLSLELHGLPLTITSGYRTPAMNEALLAAGNPVSRRSQHCEGRAADVVVEGASPMEVYAVALQCHRAGKLRLGGLGLYSEWVHVDIRPGPMKQWIGPGFKMERVFSRGEDRDGGHDLRDDAHLRSQER